MTWPPLNADSCLVFAGGLLHSHLPLRDAGGSPGPWTLPARGNERVEVLLVSRPFKVGGPSSK